jgi:hypothetical protein
MLQNQILKSGLVSSPLSKASSNLDAQTFLNAIWRSQNRVHQIATLCKPKQRFKNIPVNSVEEAIRFALKHSNEHTEIYFACAEYLTPDNRTAANVVSAYAFWLDLDCGDDKAIAGKGYATVEIAQAALEKFRKEAELPEPTYIVSSGGGLHVYWVLSNIVTREIWQVIATKLKALTKASGLLADDTRTADIASVLRIPGTLNNKYSPPRFVTLQYAADEFIEQSLMLNAITNAHNRLCAVPVVTNQEKHLPSMPKRPRAPSMINVKKINALIQFLDPDCARQEWIAIGMATYYESKGSEDGFQVWNNWSIKGYKYTTELQLRSQWRSFKLDLPTPITLGTIIKMVKDAGYDWRQICSDAEGEFEILTDCEGA